MRYFFAIIVMWSNCISAQHLDHAVSLTQYVFDTFAPGEIKMKSGEIYNQTLNYNILTNEMIFDNNGKYLAIANPQNVDTVYISDRKFIPLNNKFYQILLNTNMPLLLEFTASITEPGTSTGYGGTSTTTASTALKSLISSGGAYDLRLPDGFTVLPGFNYWILKNGKLEKAGSAKQLIKIFPDKKEIINELVKKNHVNFSKSDNVTELVKQIE